MEGEKKNECTLLVLAPEIRRKIWQYAAQNGAWVQLRLTCKQVAEELGPLCQIPGARAFPWNTVDEIEFLVTPWRPGPGPKGIETTIHWHFMQNGHPIYRSLTFYSATPYRLGFHSLDGRVRGTTERRIIELTRVARLKITYQAPSQGQFLPDFISMARKMTNVLDMIRSSNWRHGLRGAEMEIHFETLGSNVDGERRPFWEYRC